MNFNVAFQIKLIFSNLGKNVSKEVIATFYFMPNTSNLRTNFMTFTYARSNSFSVLTISNCILINSKVVVKPAVSGKL